MKRKLGLSVAAATLLASTNMMAAENLSQAFTNATMKGKATIYYQTLETEANDMFSKDSASGNAALEIGLTTEKYNGVQLDMNYVVLDQLGLNADHVNNTMQKTDTAVTDTNSEAYFSVLNISKDITETTNLKAGYQELKTPLIGSDYWQVVPNTFNAVVVTNKSVDKLGITVANVSQERKRLSTTGYAPFATDVNGTEETAWAVGLNYTGIEGTPINFWTYSIAHVSTAHYIDVSTKVAGLGIAAQYGVITPDSDASDADATSALGLEVKYKADAFGAAFAFSQVGGDSTTGSGNFAKYSDGGNKTPLYTVGVASDGDIVGATDTTSMKIAVDTNTIAQDLNLALHYTTSTHGDNSNAKVTINGSEEDVSTSIEILATYDISKSTKLFGMYGMYDHTRGAFTGDNNGALGGFVDTEGDSNNFVRLWLKHGF